MKSAWEIRSMSRRVRIARSASVAAKLAAIAGERIDIESWARAQAVRSQDAGTQALLLAKVANSLSAAGRTGGALALAREAILTGRLASRDTMLAVVDDIAPVLKAARMHRELQGLALVLDELRPWFATESPR